MLIRVGCEFAQQAQVPTHAVFLVEPRADGEFQVLEASWEAPDAAISRTYLDPFGNTCRRLTLPAGASTLRYDAVVEVSPHRDPADVDAAVLSAADLPDDVLQFTLPSRFCPSDELAPFAWERFGSLPRTWAQVQAVVDWVHGEIAFGYGSSCATTTAADVLSSRRGVCRDYAHLSVALCRALGIPARYAFGYLPDVGVEPPDAPMDFCAWTEVFLGGSWWTFDPRIGERRIGRVLIGRGRDAADVAMVTTFGGVQLDSMVVWADEVADRQLSSTSR